MLSLRQAVERECDAHGGRFYYETHPAVVQQVERHVSALAMRLSELVDCSQLHVILYWHDRLFQPQGNAQAKLHFRCATLDRLAFLVLFRIEDDALHLLPESYVIYATQWQAAPVRGDTYRSFHLRDLHKLVAPAPTPSRGDDDGDNAMVVEEARVAYHALARCTARMDELVSAPRGNPLRYAQLVLDVALRARYPALNQCEEYTAYVARAPDYSHASSLMALLYGAVQHCSVPRAHLLLERVQATERLLVRAHPGGENGDVDELTLYNFVYRALPDAPLWLTCYTIDGQAGCYWARTGVQYRVSAAWYCKMEWSDALSIPVMRDGAMVLSAQDFTQQFMPAFYAELLVDLYNYLVQVCSDRVYYWRECATLDALHGAFHAPHLAYKHDCDEETVRARITDFYATLPLDGAQGATYDWALEYGCAATQTMEQCALQQARWGGEGRRVHEFQRAVMPDIEDLGPYLPPCMAAVLKPGAEVKHDDRVDVTAYLAEMQYEKEEVVRYLGRTNDAHDVVNSYNTYVKRRAQDQEHARISLYCNGVMSAKRIARVPNTKLRCPYQRRDKLLSSSGVSATASDEQRQSCRVQCSAECSATFSGTVNHPLDYVAERLNRNK